MFIFHILVAMLIVAPGVYSQVCKPGHHYYDGCNNCTCVNGKGYACTLKLCSDNPVVCTTRNTTKTCTIGHQYYDGCNWCTCVGNGYACTKRGCLDNPVVCYVL